MRAAKHAPAPEAADRPTVNAGHLTQDFKITTRRVAELRERHARELAPLVAKVEKLAAAARQHGIELPEVGR